MTNRPQDHEADTPSVRVLVVEDDPLARTGLSLIIDSADDLRVVGQGGVGEQAIVLAAAHAPDVVLVDMRGPWSEGLATVAALRTLPRPPAVLVLAWSPAARRCSRLAVPPRSCGTSWSPSGRRGGTRRRRSSAR